MNARVWSPRANVVSGVARFAVAALAVLAVPARAADCLDPSAHLGFVGGLVGQTARDLRDDGLLATAAGVEARFYDVTRPESPRLVSSLRFAMDVKAIQFIDRYAYVIVDGHGLYVVDLSDLAAPTIVREFAWAGSINLVAIDGKRAVYGVMQSGAAARLRFVDISDPGDPQIGATEELASYAPPYCVLYGKYLYIPHDSVRLMIYDISNVRRPWGLTTVDVGGGGVSIYGDVLYEADATCVRIYSLADPLRPRLVRTVQGIRWPWRVFGHLVAATDAYGQVLLLDISTPLEPRTLAHFGSGTVVKASDRYLYFNTVSGIAIHEWPSATPTPLISETVFSPPFESGPLEVIDGWAYVADLAAYGLHLVDVRDPTAPRAVASVNDVGQPIDLVRRGDRLYLGNGGLTVLDVSDPANPSVLSSLGFETRGTGIDVQGDLAFAGTLAGIAVADISDPLAMRVIGYGADPGRNGARDVAAADGYLYVAGYRWDLYVYDVHDPTAPAFVAAFTQPARPRDIAVRAGLLYMTFEGAGLRIFDLAEPRAPRLLGTVPTPGAAYRLEFVDDLLYVACGSAGVQVYDLGTPANPHPCGYFAVRGDVADVDVSSGLVHIPLHTSTANMAPDADLAIVPAVCQPPMTIDLDIEPHDEHNRLDCHDRHGLVPVAILTTSAFDAGTVDRSTVRFGPAGAPPWFGHPDEQGAPAPPRGLGGRYGPDDRQEDGLRDVDHDGDLDLLLCFRFDATGLRCTDTVAIATGATRDGRRFLGADQVDMSGPGGGGPPRLALAASPNPFNPRVSLRFELAVAGPARLAVYDLSGRAVRVLHEGGLPAGPHELAWDGDDEAGRPLASGVYMARLETVAGHSSSRLVLLR